MASKIEVQNGTVTIDGTEYVPKGSAPSFDADTKIVILQRGWVMVGRLTRDGDQCKLHNAAVVRIWGTTNGLPEIANNGPTAKTQLDKCDGVVEFHALTVIATLSCNEAKWSL